MRFQTLDQVATAASARAVQVERLHARCPTLRLTPCPGCHQAAALAEDIDGLGIILTCRNCMTDIAHLLDQPRELLTPTQIINHLLGVILALVNDLARSEQ